MSPLLMVISSNTFFSSSARLEVGDLQESLVTTNMRLEDQAIAR
ncbi:unnamed protein product [Musa textilis]